MYQKLTAVALVGALALSACTTAQSQREQNSQVGSVIGALAGGALGSTFGEGGGKTAATIGGALLGMWAGSHIGANMTQQDRAYHSQATEQAYQAPIGEAITWNNPQSGHQGTVVPVRDGYTQSGRYCREFQQTVSIGGQRESAYGTACRQPDGSWEIVN